MAVCCWVLLSWVGLCVLCSGGLWLAFHKAFTDGGEVGGDELGPP